MCGNSIFFPDPVFVFGDSYFFVFGFSFPPVSRLERAKSSEAAAGAGTTDVILEAEIDELKKQIKCACCNQRQKVRLALFKSICMRDRQRQGQRQRQTDRQIDTHTEKERERSFH